MAVEQARFADNSDIEFRSPIGNRLKNIVPLATVNEFKIRDAGINYQRVKVGMQQKGKSDLADRLLYEGESERSIDQMFWKGSDMDRYWMATATNRWCRPDISLRSNEVVRLNKRVYTTVPKILMRQTADRPIATIDQAGIWFGRSIIAITSNGDAGHSLRYLAGLLNSRYMTYVYHEITSERGRVFAQVKLAKIKQLPIRTLDFSIEEDNKCHNRMVALVQQMLDLHARLPNLRTEHERTALARQIEHTDAEIDRLVYELYGLSEEEIAIVEGATTK
jgi:TaqI-like C-terminal specificity domain